MKIDTQMHIMKQVSDMIGWFFSVKDESIMRDIYDTMKHNWYKQLPPIPRVEAFATKKEKKIILEYNKNFQITSYKKL